MARWLESNEKHKLTAIEYFQPTRTLKKQYNKIQKDFYRAENRIYFGTDNFYYDLEIKICVV
jgi:hypothetical protein